jgi:hypothetical protein
MMIKRREAIERIALVLGGTLSAQLTAGLMGQVLYPGAGIEISAEQRALLADVAEVIIPETDTPGAKAAGVEQFVIRVIRDCYPWEEQKAFYAGLSRLDAEGKSLNGKGFVSLDPVTKADVLTQAMKSDKPFFSLMKQLTIAGYFISEIGATKALQYLPIPGRFEGDVPLQADQKVWAL